jgi:hypothetical protein
LTATAGTLVLETMAMCDTRPPTTPRPRWGALYLRLLGAAAAGLLGATRPLGTTLGAALGVVLTLAAAVMVLGWIRANAAALDQAAWCACASRETTMRVVASTTARPRRRRRRRRRATLGV